MFNILLLTSLVFSIVECQFSFNLHKTSESDSVNYFEYDCFRHYGMSSQRNLDLILQPPHQRMEMIEYCIRPTNAANQINLNFVNIHDENLTFDELYYLNISEETLISLSATIDLVEKYVDFLNDRDKRSLLSKTIYYNCKKPWFGNRCEYSFELYNSRDWSLVVSKAFNLKKEYGTHINAIDRTCYINVKCNRGGSSICLDWREICNGQIDCLDNGEDEKECFQLELNECNLNEYRCLNGLCISKDLSDDEEHLTHCLDRSISKFAKYDSNCLTDPMFVCEEYLCPPNNKQFSCGDGQCVEYFDKCQNGRHYLLIESISIQGNLSKQCWLSLICLTKIQNLIHNNSCQNFVNSSDLFNSFQTCDEITEFPLIPVLYGHITFLYKKKENEKLINIDLVLPPDYICYDNKLCDYLQVNFTYKNKTCQMANQMGIQSNIEYYNWKSIIDTIKIYFKGCLTYYRKEKKTNLLYSCQNSSKLISNHRILDGISDCYLNDDEKQFQLSCLLNDNQRLKCPNENICYSPFFLPKKLCPKEIIPKKINNLLFNQICDRIVHLLPQLINGENHTDETECEYWPCSNIYSRCNLFWNCLNGDDELSCPKSACNSLYHPCISPYNGTFKCLSKSQINDGIIDCLGGSDELRYCLEMESINEDIGRYHCFNEDRCIQSNQLCDRKKDCLFGDDEAFCNDIRQGCSSSFVGRTNIEITLCQLKNLKQIEFSLERSQIYPPYNFRIINHKRLEDSSIIKMTDDLSWTWYCNRGLYARYWTKENNSTFKCFCPPSYYGDLCQYQSDRVSLSLKLLTNNFDGIYVILIRLINADGEINSYEQINYSPKIDLCSYIYDIYLLYLNRSKDLTKTYIIHIDAFDKISLNYISSWYFTIPFIFLPVNRLSFQLYIPTSRIIHSNQCKFRCENGECIKYLNVDKMSCRCNSGWSGLNCNIRLNCNDCSSDSICLGSISNRSICICPINKFGSRCLLKRRCITGTCSNNGQCIILDESISTNNYVCICPKPYSGSECDFIKPYKLEILLKDIESAKFVSIYKFDVSDNNKIISQGSIREKLKMFQNAITFYHTGGYNIIIIEINDNYYLSSIQLLERRDYSTSISSNEECLSINKLLNSTIINFPKIRQVKYYHKICEINNNLLCFYDEYYMCLCNREHFANCFHFEHNNKLKFCRYNYHCFNDGKCLTDNPKCPKLTICECINCYFGDRCQFYAKGIGLTLDDILRYEIRPNLSLINQPISIKISLSVTIIMFGLGLINSLLSLLVFYNKNSLKVGCGVYLLMSSITSFLTLSCLTMKFWFLILSQMNISPNRFLLRVECVFIEIFLKLFLYTDSWLNACVALERSITIFKGINFNPKKSQKIAYYIIIILPFLILLTIVHEFFYRDLFDDIEEERIWCVNNYSSFIQIYNTFILFFHFLGPFLLNLFSALFIIYQTSRQRATIRTRKTPKQHLFEQFKEHKHLIISPILLVILSIPRLIISLLSGCVKVSHNPFIYISGYFISFIPSVLIFIIFVLPSNTYKEQFKESVKRFQRFIH